MKSHLIRSPTLERASTPSRNLVRQRRPTLDALFRHMSCWSLTLTGTFGGNTLEIPLT
jgi:hypothetical protein